MKTLADNDTTVRQFNDSLAAAPTCSPASAQDLAAVLRNLGIAMVKVHGFVKDNKDLADQNIRGLNQFAKVIVKQRDALDETLRDAPAALNNLSLAVQPEHRHARHPRQRRRGRQPAPERPCRPVCSFLGGAANATEICGQAARRPSLPRSRRLTGSRPAPATSSTSTGRLGGLVEVTR